MLPSAERVREVLHYDPETGVFTWIKTLSIRAVAGKVAGTVNKRGYRLISVDKKTIPAHRLAWLHYYGKNPEGVIDHINGMTGDNRIENLRDVSQMVNTRNSRIYKNNSSGYPGVYLDKKRNVWYVQIWDNMKCLSIGSSKSYEECVAMRKEAEKRLGYVTNLTSGVS